jgi:hypothetical protein
VKQKPCCWLPTNIQITRKSILVKWMECSPLFADPLFPETVENLRRRRPAPSEVLTTVDALEAHARLAAPVEPAGLIFHISRCGSTLISNALRTAQHAIVIAEAQPISAALELGDASRRGQVIHDLARIYSAFGRHGHSAQLVLKFSSSDTLYLSRLRALWPHVPCLFVIRNPVEVIVSALANPPGWLRNKRTVSAGDLLSESLECVSEVEFSARVLGRFCRCALAESSGHFKVIDHADINIVALRHIAELFGLRLPHEGPALEGILKYHSKNRSVEFDDDRDRKRRSATEQIRAAAKVWVEPYYQRLRDSVF